MSMYYYVTARKSGKCAVLAGPWAYRDQAESYVQAARDFLAANLWRDTLGAFVEVGVTGTDQQVRARFHRSIVEGLS